jgi:hypothetical protein
VVATLAAFEVAWGQAVDIEEWMVYSEVVLAVLGAAVDFVERVVVGVVEVVGVVVFVVVLVVLEAAVGVAVVEIVQVGVVVLVVAVQAATVELVGSVVLHFECLDSHSRLDLDLQLHFFWDHFEY